MAKNEISEYDEVDAGNTDISGIVLSDATFIDQLDNIARAQMGALKRWFKTSLFRLRDGTDQTKLLSFNLASLTTATERTLTVPDKNGTIALLSDVDDTWALQPIGVPVPLLPYAGVPTPPTNKAYRYIKLTASDAYNTGVLTGEAISGSAPLLTATAVISDTGSPLNGGTVNLINTDRRFLRAGQPGILQDDAFQGHSFNFTSFVNVGGGSLASSSTPTNPATNSVGSPVSDGVNGAPRIANETRGRNIGVTFYMRIK